MKLLNNQHTSPSLVDKFTLYTKESESGCLEWQAGKTKDGYGIVNFDSQSKLAHRVSYELFNGNVGSNCVCHKCDNPSCVNPSHLFLGIHKDNMNDMKIKGRRKGIGLGELNGRAKLADSQHDLIKAKRASGMPLKDLAKEFNVSLTTISRISRM